MANYFLDTQYNIVCQIKDVTLDTDQVLTDWLSKGQTNSYIYSKIHNFRQGCFFSQSKSSYLYLFSNLLLCVQELVTHFI